MNDAAHIESTKRAIRADIRDRRSGRRDTGTEALQAGLTANLLRITEAAEATSVACYLSNSIEPPTREFIVQAHARGIEVLLPIAREDGLLDWIAYSGDALETAGLFGVPELAGEPVSPLAINGVDVIFVPASAVDRSGMRLGWGRGYYDKMIGSMEGAPPLYAVVFDDEVLDEVPCDLHDQPVNGAVTPTRILTFSHDEVR